MPRKSPKPALPIGTRVRLKRDGCGACRPHTTPVRDADDVDLYHVVEEIFGSGDTGVVVFAHPNHKALPDWVYVEVDSKQFPGEKRYVGETVHALEIL